MVDLKRKKRVSRADGKVFVVAKKTRFLRDHRFASMVIGSDVADALTKLEVAECFGMRDRIYVR